MVSNLGNTSVVKFNLRSRRAAREAALQAIYQCDSLGTWTKKAVALFFDRFYPSDPLELGALEQECLTYCRDLIAYSCANLGAIDDLLAQSSLNWPISRICRVERSILRVAIGELLGNPELPYKVVINEAIEIAKRFGGEEAPTFVNGVLDGVVSRLECSDSKVGSSKVR